MKQEQVIFQAECNALVGYICILIADCHPGGSIIIKQEGLTKRVAKALFLDTNNTSAAIIGTPAAAYLPINEEGEPTQGLYNYGSVGGGMLNYLQDLSYIDITFDVSQIARYAHSPKRSHELTLEWIAPT